MHATMRTTQGSRRDFKALERRRLTAARLFAVGNLRDAEIARRVGVSRQSILRWRQDWKRGGPAALRAAGRAGRKPKLGPAQLRAVEAALRQGPVACGFRTELWTLPRLAAVIARQSGARYHPGHVWRLMRQLGWSLQRPATRARERDPAAIRRWWPRGGRR